MEKNKCFKITHFSKQSLEAWFYSKQALKVPIINSFGYLVTVTPSFRQCSLNISFQSPAYLFTLVVAKYNVTSLKS